MRNLVLTAFGAAVLMSAPVVGARAAATAASAPPATSATQAALIREAAIVCGGNGCNAVQTKATKKRKFQTLGHG
jgi:hypothetical protein